MIFILIELVPKIKKNDLEKTLTSYALLKLLSWL
tara:strand:+ start:32527 stop:32628 length:102 start_codon:yes stop_codon:yes gene_type:complete